MDIGKRRKRNYNLNRHHTVFLVLAAAMAVGGVVYWWSAHPSGSSTVQLAYGDTAYTVVPGDTLNAIAARYGISAGAIMSENGITNPNLVIVGARLRIP